MPRQLPWKVGAAAATKQASSRPNKAPASPAPSAGRSPAASHRPTPTPNAESTPNSKKPRRSFRRSFGLSSARSPSTSPPPEPLKEEFMIEGIDHDDRYRMVEDEFRAVAGEFTRHLHAAEYQRLKNLAKSQNAEAIQNISRPVTGEMTDLVKRRHAALSTASKQRKGIAKLLGKRAAENELESDDEEELPRRPATSLQGLMDSPRKQAVVLTSVTGTRPGSSRRGPLDASPSRRRPNAGIVRNNIMDVSNRTSTARVKPEPMTDSDDDDEDPDFQPPWPRRPDLRRPEQTARPPVKQPSAQIPPARTRSESNGNSNPFVRTGTARLQTLAQQSTPSRHIDNKGNEKDEEDDDPLSRLRARRAEQKRRRETKVQDSNIKTSESQAASINSIPFI